MTKATTFPQHEFKDLPWVFTALQVAVLTTLGFLAGIVLMVLIYNAHKLKPVSFVSAQGSVYYESETKGVTVTYWSNGKVVGSLDRVESAVCRNLCEADSITIKTPWP